MCCGNYNSRGQNCGKCELERLRDHWTDSGKAKNLGSAKLEGGEELIVLFRLQDKHITQVKVASDNCVLDAGGLPLVWLTGRADGGERRDAF